MFVVSYKESSGRVMYLTECFGSFFWAPSRASAYRFEDKKEMERVMNENLSEDFKEGLNIVNACLSYFILLFGLDEGTWFLARNKKGEYDFVEEYSVVQWF